MSTFLASLGQVPPLAVYAFIFAWLAAESTGFPVPNELVLLLAGSLAAQGRVSPVALVLVATAGSLTGASIAYTIGRRGGRPLVLRLGRYLRLDAARLDTLEQQFARSGAVAIAVARITPFVRTVASFPAGMLRLPWRSFLLATLIGSLLWCTVMVTIGNLLGVHYLLAVRLIERYTVPAVVVLLALVAGYFWLHARLRRGGHRALSAEERATLAEREASRQRERP